MLYEVITRQWVSGVAPVGSGWRHRACTPSRRHPPEPRHAAGFFVSGTWPPPYAAKPGSLVLFLAFFAAHSSRSATEYRTSGPTFVKRGPVPVRRHFWRVRWETWYMAAACCSVTRMGAGAAGAVGGVGWSLRLAPLCLLCGGAGLRRGCRLRNQWRTIYLLVITSYSIHYTKLYEDISAAICRPRNP